MLWFHKIHGRLWRNEPGRKPDAEGHQRILPSVDHGGFTLHHGAEGLLCNLFAAHHPEAHDAAAVRTCAGMKSGFCRTGTGNGGAYTGAPKFFLQGF